MTSRFETLDIAVIDVPALSGCAAKGSVQSRPALRGTQRSEPRVPRRAPHGGGWHRPGPARRFRFQPDGLFGGEHGAAASCNIERDGEITELPCKESAWLRAGDVLTVSTGGGGYGAPERRSAERIDDDAAQRRTSARLTSSFERPDAEIAK